MRDVRTEPELASAPALARAASLVTRLTTAGVNGFTETPCVSTRSWPTNARLAIGCAAVRARLWKWNIKKYLTTSVLSLGNRATAVRGASKLQWYPSKRVTRYQGKRGRARAEIKCQARPVL